MFLREALSRCVGVVGIAISSKLSTRRPVSLEQTEPKIAGTLLGAADAGYAAEHRRPAMPVKARYEGLRARLAERIGARDLAQALDEGASLTLDEAIVAALQALEPQSHVRV